LIRIFHYIETKYRFKVAAAPYIRTYANVTADDLSRLTEEETDRVMKAKGLQKIDVSEGWRSVLQTVYDRQVHAVALVDQEDWRVAMQLRARRTPEDPPKWIGGLEGWRIVEVEATMGAYARVGAAVGAQACVRPSAGWEKVPALVGLELDPRSPAEGSAGAMVTASLGPTGAASVARQLVSAARGVGAEWMLFDAPPGTSGAEAMAVLGRSGWQATTDTALCSELGDPIAQRKQWVLATCDGSQGRPPDGWLRNSGRIRALPMPMAAGLDHPTRVQEASWLDSTQWDLTLDPRIGAKGDCLPKIVGHVAPTGGGGRAARRNVYGSGGPTPTLRLGPDGALVEILVHVPHGERSCRRLTREEAWHLREYEDAVRTIVEEEMGPRDADEGLLRSLPRKSTSEVLGAALEHATAVDGGKSKAGVCRRPEDDRRREEMHDWLKGRHAGGLGGAGKGAPPKARPKLPGDCIVHSPQRRPTREARGRSPGQHRRRRGRSFSGGQGGRRSSESTQRPPRTYKRGRDSPSMRSKRLRGLTLRIDSMRVDTPENARIHQGLAAASEPGTPYIWCIFRVWIHETREWDWVAYLGVVVGSKMWVCDVAPEIEVRNLFVEVPRLDLGYEVPRIEVNSHEVNATTTAERIREAKHELYVQIERTEWRPRAVYYWLREEDVLKLADYDGHPLIHPAGGADGNHRDGSGVLGASHVDGHRRCQWERESAPALSTCDAQGTTAVSGRL
jgi:hypothetical protein